MDGAGFDPHPERPSPRSGPSDLLLKKESQRVPYFGGVLVAAESASNVLTSAPGSVGLMGVERVHTFSERCP